jgi:membrane fusion protein YbhG
MNHKRPPILVIFLVVLLVLAILAGGYFGLRTLQNTGVSALTASGTIETTEVTVSPEIGGKVTAVLVDEGSSVKRGELLFRLDDTLLQAQAAVATANLNSAHAGVTTANATLATAQAQYDLAVNAAQAEATATRTSSWTADYPAGYTLPGWYFNQTEGIASAQSEVDAAKSALDAAQNKLNGLQNDSTAANFLAVENRLNDARTALMVADAVLTRAKAARDNAELQLAAQKRYDSAKTDLDNAQSDYDDLSSQDIAKNILTARAELAAAQERYDTARDRLLSLQTGDQSPKLTAAKATLNQAQASAEQSMVAVTQAQANLDLLNDQIAKLAILAPSDGVILTRSIEPGEVIPAGAAAFTLGRLDNLTITVYIPEDRYGEVKLGQAASVTVDPFPRETFTATIIHIADQAEFTPRNVQTVSGRKSTVFAIKLQVQDPNGKLKPGMPADVTFKR